MLADHLISWNSVAEVFAGKRVAIVGSGPGSKGNPPGFVDSHDVIVRVNNYACEPNSGTGMRTDVHYSFYGTSITKTAHELQRDGVRMCMNKCPNGQFIESEWHRKRGKLNGVDFRYIYQARESFWFCDTWVPDVDHFMRGFNLLGGKVPTTGFTAILDVLACSPRHVFLTGFDFFQSGVHNLNERWKPGNPSDPIGHTPEGERAWLLQNFERLPVTMDEMLSQALYGRVKSMAPSVSFKGRQLRIRERKAQALAIEKQLRAQRRAAKVIG